MKKWMTYAVASSLLLTALAPCSVSAKETGVVSFSVPKGGYKATVSMTLPEGKTEDITSLRFAMYVKAQSGTFEAAPVFDISGSVASEVHDAAVAAVEGEENSYVIDVILSGKEDQEIFDDAGNAVIGTITVKPKGDCYAEVGVVKSEEAVEHENSDLPIVYYVDAAGVQRMHTHVTFEPAYLGKEEPQVTVTPEITVHPGGDTGSDDFKYPETPDPTITPSPSEPTPTVDPNDSSNPDPTDTPAPPHVTVPSVSPTPTPTEAPSGPEPWYPPQDTPTDTPIPTSSPTPVPSVTVTPSVTPSVTPEVSETPTPSAAPSATPEPTVAPTITPGPVTSKDGITADPLLGTKKVELSWEASEDVDGYVIELKDEATGKFKRIKTIKGAKNTSFTTKAMEEFGGVYTYRVRSYKKVEGGPSIYEDVGEEITVMLYYYNKSEKPAVKAAGVDGSTGITVEWNAVKGSDGYMVYMYNASTKKYVLLDQLKGEATTSYQVKSDLKVGTTYAFRVRAYAVKDDGKQVNGKISATVKGTTAPAAAKKPAAASRAKQQVKLSWKKVSGADGYQVYRSTSKKGEYAAVGTLGPKKLSFTDKNLKSGTTYYYKICAYSKNPDGKLVLGKLSAAKAVKVK